MGHVKRARLRQKEDVDIEVLWDGDQDSYVIKLSNSSSIREILIPEKNLFDRAIMIKFFMKYAKLTYNSI